MKRKLTSDQKRAKEIIQSIVKFLNRSNFKGGNDGGNLLWHVLTALRGPDSGSDVLKEFTTAKVRAAIGIKPTGHNRAGAIVGVRPTTLPSAVPYNEKHGEISYHFNAHFSKAVEALKVLGFIES